jgi:hypothetical protein
MPGYSLLRTLETQMNSLENHLEPIIKSLTDIEERLGQGQSIQINFTEERKEIAANRLKVKAEELTKECEKYLAETEVTKATETF